MTKESIESIVRSKIGDKFDASSAVHEIGLGWLEIIELIMDIEDQLEIYMDETTEHEFHDESVTIEKIVDSFVSLEQEARSC